MPISSTHPLYAEQASPYQDCRNAFDGQRAIKKAGIRYLPRLLEQDSARYEAYKDRALFYSITSKTVGALVGMVLSRPAITEYPDEMDHFFNDTTGLQFQEVLVQSVSENLLMGRYALLVDADDQLTSELNVRPYIAESIINWSVDSAGNPIWVVLKESVLRPVADDPFETETVTNYRHLYLDGGIYNVAVYNEKEEIIKTITPLFSGRTIDYIPIVAINPFGVSFDVYKPPMIDIVDINISHYRTSADLEHGRHFCGLPTPVISGVDKTSKMSIGGETAWVLPDHQARAYFLEFTGQGLLSLEKALEEKQSQLASLSARLLDNSKRGSEAAETVRLRYMSETATLSMIVSAVEKGLNRLYKIIAELMGEDTNSVSIKLNKEFLTTKLSPAELTSLIKSFLDGGISKETLIYNLRRGDILNPTDKDVDELSRINPVNQGAQNES